ncbi:alpha/beta hydrolase [Streptomyces sp. enrichment culture]|uniref:alpha/beta hydrolase n=1 Tax=Streptomyces sp. enrichment culture TaxID=1795815 RepID=UPI003F555D9B
MRTTTRGKRAVAAGAAACAAAVLITAPTGAAATEHDLDAHHSQHLRWQPCAAESDGDAAGRALAAAGAQCAEVTVPLDHSDPHGPTLTVAISRLPATSAGERIGALLMNPGGPAGTGLDMPVQVAGSLGEDLAGRYDLIGFDPRGAGRSTPVDCGWPVGSGIFGPGPDRGSYLRHAAAQWELAERCRATEGETLPYLTTRNTARDMDVIRHALGERRISYLGYSYGSYLGEVYTQLFPGRTDRVVLDGVIHPGRYTPTLLRGTEAANEAALAEWADWAAQRQDRYGLGATGQEVRDVVDTIRAAAERAPLRVGAHTVDAHTVPLLLFSGIGSGVDASRDRLATSVGLLARAAAGEQVTPDPDFAEELTYLTTGAGSAYGSAQMAIICGDVAAPRGVDAYWQDIERARAVHPFAGPLANNITPCEFWDEPLEAPTVLDNDIPALLVAATGDPRTPYEGTVEMREEWPASRLLTLEGAAHHAVYGEYGSACVDDLVNDYLRTGALPTTDLSCPA